MTRLMLITAICLAGCEPHAGTVSQNGMEYRVRKIDGCEYIEVDHGIFDQRV